MTAANYSTLDMSQFLSLFPMRAPKIMWLLGAGASVNAGLPTAGTLIWEFKRTLYCNENRIPESRFPNLSDPAFQSIVQRYFDSKGTFPPQWANDEYSEYFEKYLADERDRRRFMERRLSDAKPSYGHLALAALIALKQINVVWTTNFDELIEKSLSHPLIAARLAHTLTTVTLECPDKAIDLFRDERWPALIKIHGDYQYRKLKNIKEELAAQDEVLRKYLISQLGRNGLAVIGFSGRDQSVMDALHSSLDETDPYPHGLFWFGRLGEQPHSAVENLLQKAAAKGVSSAFIEVGGFDELLADLFLPHHSSFPDLAVILAKGRERRRMIIPEYRSKPWPVIRFNALEITQFPVACMVFQADVGGAKELKELTKGHEGSLALGRKKAGIIGFGSRAKVQEVFALKNPREFDIHPIDTRQLWHDDSVEAGLFYQTIARGIAAKTRLRQSANAKGRILFIPDTSILSKEEKNALTALKSAGVQLVKSPASFVHEAIRLSVEYRDQRVWLLFEPTIMVTSDGVIPYNESDRSQIGRELLVRRYNSQAVGFIEFWIRFLIARCGDPIQVTFPEGGDSPAKFIVNTITAFTRPL